MSFNGSGAFSINTAGQPVAANTLITSTAFNLLTADLATGLSTAICKDGQSTVTANIPFAGFRATNVGITGIAGSVGTPAINLSDSATGLYRTAANQIGVAVSGALVANFSSTGLIRTAQPSFFAFKSAQTNNQTGNGGTYALICDTEVSDVGGMHNASTGVVTALATGAHRFSGGIYFTGCTVATGFAITLTIAGTSGRVYQIHKLIRGASAQDYLQPFNITDVPMTVGDTAAITATVTGEAGDTVDIFGTSTPNTWFAGGLQ